MPRPYLSAIGGPVCAGSLIHLKMGCSVAMGKSVRSSEASWCSPSSEPRTDSLASPALSTTWRQSEVAVAGGSSNSAQ